ncbi:MAG: hypothetical protein HQK84_02460 [Nitrospinae bacterium]|nr:hypothetical protein [Nitrospinota bacterium]
MKKDALTYNAPVRMDFAGGTIDLWPLYNFFQPTVVVNMAIDLNATVTIRKTKDKETIKISSIDQKQEVTLYPGNEKKIYFGSKLPLVRKVIEYYGGKGGIEIISDCKVPDGSGLGGSSSLNIALNVLCNHFYKKGFTDEEILEVSKNLESQVLGIPTGTQDYYPPLYGGVQIIHYLPEGIKREEVTIDTNKLLNRLVLVYSHKPKFHGINNWDVYKSCIDGNKMLMNKMKNLSEISLKMAEAFRNSDFDEIGKLINEEWQKRRGIAKNISTPLIEQMITAGRQSGAMAAKVCGAGGGGCLFFYCNEGTKEDVQNTVASLGGTILDFTIVKKRPVIIKGA